MLKVIATVLLVAGIGFEAATPAAQSIPTGTVLDLMLRKAIDSKAAKADDKFETTLLNQVDVAGIPVIEAGAVVAGYVGSVRHALPAKESRLTLAFNLIRVNDRELRLRGTVAALLDPRKVDDSTRSSVGPITGVPSGPRQFVGAVVTEGGTIVARDGADVKLPVGIIIRIRLDEPLVVPVK